MAINIPEPCHENWSYMSPTERGAFCKACSKEVIDFTDKTPLEIKGIFAKEFAENRTPCARITNFQLNQINDDFFRWKNETETFRAVWIFSLIAVFGLSLFSCQNTATKELVNQMQIESSLLLDSLQPNDLVALDTMTETSTTLNLDTIHSTPIALPWEFPQISGGVVPWSPDIITNIDWTTICSPWGIDFLGIIEVEPEEKEVLQDFMKTALMDLPIPLETKPSPKLPTPQTPKSVRMNNEAVLHSGDKKFSAFIYPNPIVSESRLYVDVSENVDLHLMVQAKNDTQTLLQLSITLAFGRYVLDPELSTFSPGTYELRIASASQVSVLDFAVEQAT